MRAVGAGVLKLIVATLALTLLAWAASELYYRACVGAAAARTPVKVTSAPAGTGMGGQISYLVGQAQRRHAVDGCSRLP